MGSKLPVPVHKEDFDKLVEYVKSERERFRKKRSGKLKPTGVKMNELLIFMSLSFGAGLRISEVVGLYDKTTETWKIPKLTRDKIENNFIRVTGKGKKDRIVPLPVKVFRQAGITRLQLENSLPLSLERRTVQRLITKIGKDVLGKHITAHMLRHGFVTHALESGLDIHQVQAFAGHSRLDTTGIYLHANPEKALSKYEEVF